MPPPLIRLARAFGLSVLLLLVAGVAVAAAADIGHKDFLATGGARTGSKPESKLWFNDGFWWASLYSTNPAGFYIYKLDTSSDTWNRTSAALDPRSGSRADTLWDGTKLYVASQVWSADGGSTGSGSNYEARLYRYSYNSSTDTYSLDNGFPAIIRAGVRSETLVIAKDSTGMLWATWTQKGSPSSTNLVYTAHTIGNNDANWSAPAALPVGSPGTTANDDIASIIAFTVSGQHRVGVFWSNQRGSPTNDYFAWHVDGAADAAWTLETALSGSSQADDHMNLKTDSAGVVYAVVKTSLTGSNPLIRLLRRTTSGTWSAFNVGTGSDSNTRAILELDESAGKLHVFMTGPQPPDTTGQSGGDIYEKVSNTSTISFPSGAGTIVIQDSGTNGNDMNDASSTKQNIDSTTGVVVMAFNDTTDFYWHARETLSGGGGAPVANFSASPTTGPPGQTVTFTDQSTNSPNQWLWDFGDPSSGLANSSALPNPTHQYATAGQYTVKLTATNGSGSNQITKANYITISGGGGGSTITLAPDADTQVKVGSSTNLGANIQLRTREENPVASNTYRSYLRFNVQGLTGTVNTVTLRLWVDTASANTQTVLNTTSNPTWPELTTNGTNAPAIGSTVYGSSTASPAGAYKEITLLPSSIGGNGLVTFALRSSGTTSAYFSSKEGAHPPQLVITQTVVNNPPVANFSGAPTIGTPGMNVQFTDLSTNSPTSWAWDFDNDGTVDSTAQNPSHVYPSVGTFTVVMTATNGSGPDTKTMTNYIQVGLAPVASFTPSATSGPAPLNVNFTDTSTNSPTSWAWDFDNNGSVDDTTQNPSHTYASGGTFTAKLTATNAFGSNSTTQQITVTGPPTADFSGTPLFIHPGDSVQFTDLTTGQGPFTWAWDFDNNGTVDDTTQNPSHVYSSVGVFSVSLTATNGAGPNTKTRTNYVNVGNAPAASFAANPDSGTAPLTVNFANSSTGTDPLSYAWDFDNNGTIDNTAATPSHVFAAGSYTVKLTVTSPYGTDSVTHPVTATGGTPTTITLNPVADTQINSGSPTANYGTATSIRTREGSDPIYRVYFKFTIPVLSGSVSSAKLRLFVTTASVDTQTVYAVADTTWTETGLNWNGPPVGGPTIGASVGTGVGSTAGVYVEIPINTSAISSNATLSFSLRSSSSHSLYFNTRESATNKPELVIVTGP